MEITTKKSNRFGSERGSSNSSGERNGRFGMERGYENPPVGNPVYHEHDGIDQPRLYPKYFHGYPIYDTAPTFKAEEGVSVLVNTNYQVNYNTLVGLFTPGEIIQDDQGNEATIVSVSNLNQGVIVVTNLGGTKIGDNGATTITGQSSGATANILSVSNGFVYWYTMLNKVWNLMGVSFAFSPTNDLTVNSVTIGGGTFIKKVISSTATLDFGPIAVNKAADLTMTLTGAAIGDTVSLGVADGVISGGVNCADITFFAWVSAANTVKIRCLNGSAVNIANPASGIFRSTIIQF